MIPYSERRKGRGQWRYFVGLSVLGLLIIASASHASETAQVAPAQSASIAMAE